MYILSNLFSAIKNGFLNQKSIIIQANTKLNKNILNILIHEGFIKNYKIIDNNKLKIYIKYINNQSVISGIQCCSRPGKQLYIKNKNLFFLKKGIYLLSTSKGIMTNIEAKKLNIGGELLCHIY